MAGPSGKAASDEPDTRIAVVFVHGQGEQTPLADVVELVESVWRTDPRASTDDPPSLAPVYAAPLYDSDSSGQRRIVTRVVDGRQVDFYQFYWADLMQGNRLAHLWRWFLGLMKRQPDEVPRKLWPVRTIAMNIALFLGVWGPIFALTTAVRLARAIDWSILIILVPIAFAAGAAASRAAPVLPRSAHRTAGRKESDRQGRLLRLAPGLLLIPLLVLPFLKITADPFADIPARAVVALVAGLIAAAIFSRLLSITGLGLLNEPQPSDWLAKSRKASFERWASRLFLMVFGSLLLIAAGVLIPAGWRWNDGLAIALVFFAAFLLPHLLAPGQRGRVFALGAGLTLASLVLSVLPMFGVGEPGDDAAGSPRPSPVLVHSVAFSLTLAALVVVAGVGRLLNESFLTPVMTDSARMFSDSPFNVPNQNAIRERGMKLLEMLHKPGKRPYDRVVVLAHSLGAAVGYRLLAHYWGVVYDDLHAGAAMSAVPDLERAAADLNAASANGKPPPAEELIAWRQAVRRYWAALNPPRRREAYSPTPWLITDFVTIGAPLTYARLLLEDSDRAFLEQVRMYKRHPTSPPQSRNNEPTGETVGPMFKDGVWPHHAALFAATCWTNLYFPSESLIHGDVIGGPIRGAPPEGLGFGVLDVDLGADESVEGFTHNEYWKWPRPPEPAPRPTKRSSAPFSPDDLAAPLHVAALRDALGLFVSTLAEAEEADRRLLSPETNYLSPSSGPAPLLVLRGGWAP